MSEEQPNPTFAAADIEVGFHPDGYRIDKTASPMDRYTRWTVTAGGQWTQPTPVCFDALPQEGWRKAERSDGAQDATETGDRHADL